ncbi:MAG: DUF192 domain-containing protein [Patescibacteria group bacterium]
MRLLILSLVSLSLIVGGCSFNPSPMVKGIKLPSSSANTENICFKNDCFKVELAVTQIERAQGLMYRDKMEIDRGMFFIFPNVGSYDFWMKHTLIPLDIIWLDENYQVVDIKNNAAPCLQTSCPIFTSSVRAKFVLEINGGQAEKIGLKVGDYFYIVIPAKAGI